jgi:hypothetical protein
MRVRSLIPMVMAAVVAPAVLVVAPQVASASQPPTIAALALANVGKKACSVNSLKGKAFYSSCTGNGGLPEYWCADFARWVWANAGVADTDSLDAMAGSFYTYGVEYDTLTARPAVGDAVVFDYTGHGIAQHVAIVTQVNPDGTIESVSGDWGGRGNTEGGYSSTSIVHNDSPAYPGQLATSPNAMGTTISAFVAPVGVSVTPVIAATSVPAGHVLTSGDTVASPSGVATLAMETNGDLVEYVAGRIFWSTGTEGHSGASASLRADGDLVVRSTNKTVLWSSRTGGRTGTFALVLQDNGELLIDGQTGAAFWTRQPDASKLVANGTLVAGQQLVSKNGFYTLHMQLDGNLVEYAADRAIWSTRTEGHAGDHLALQPKGDLVLLPASGTTPLWAPHTGSGTGPFSLVMGNDGALEVVGSTGALWSNSL